MKFNIKELNPGVWFYFNDDKPEEGGVCLRRMTSQRLKEINKETQSVKVEFRKRRRHEVVKTDDYKHDLLFWDYCIADWVAVEDNEGNPIPPTPENKGLLMGGSPGFASFVAEGMEALDVEFNAMAKDVPEN